MPSSIRRTLIALVLLTAALPDTTTAQGVIVIGVEPEMYPTVVSGVQGWNAAGVGFVVQPTGCGTGDVTFCYSGDPWSVGGDASWIAWWPIGANTIYVSTVSPYAFTAQTVCHELGHWLGLHYHRSDYASCMNDPGPGAPSWPDNADIANLGLSWTSAPAPQPQEATVPAVTGLPKTGSGTFGGFRP